MLHPDEFDITEQENSLKGKIKNFIDELKRWDIFRVGIGIAIIVGFALLIRFELGRSNQAIRNEYFIEQQIIVVGRNLTGFEQEINGVVDLISMKAYTYKEFTDKELVEIQEKYNIKCYG